MCRIGKLIQYDTLYCYSQDNKVRTLIRSSFQSLGPNSGPRYDGQKHKFLLVTPVYHSSRSPLPFATLHDSGNSMANGNASLFDFLLGQTIRDAYFERWP